MTETKREIPGLSPASIKMDLLHFKDEILKDIRTVQLTLDDKYLKVDDFIKERLEHFELKINSFSQKIAELSNLIITDTTIREKVETFEQFKEEIRDTIFKRRAKFSELEKKVNDDIDRINHILTDSVIYPSLIGNATKFKTFHEFMDYVVQEISQLNLFKDKSGLDITPYKKKIDQTVETLKLQINSFVSKDLLDNAINKSEDNIKHILKIYDDRLQDTRVENSHYSFGLEKKAKEISKQMENMQKAFNKKMEKNKLNEEIFNEYNKELININTRLDKMNEIIKELLGYHPASKKIFMPAIEKKSSKVYSGVKQYIKGNLNANELTSMKKFTYEKSKTKCFDKSYPSPTTSPFPSEDIIKYKNNDYQKKNSNSNFLSNNYMPISLNSQISSDSNNTRIERKKTFVSQKSFNNSNLNLRDSLTKKFSEIEDNINFNNENNDKIFKKNTFIRKRTYNYEKVKSTELSKKNVEGNKEYEENKNFNKDNEDDLSDSFLKDANINTNNNNKDMLVLNDYNQNAIKKCSTTIKKVTNNQYIIKEEDEYILSDASCKNGELNSTKRTHNNQSVKNNSEEENENKNKNNDISGIKDNSNDNKENKNKNNTINNSNSNDNKENISNNNSNNNDNKEKKNISNNNLKNNDIKDNNTNNNSNTNDKSINNIVNEVINESIVNNDDSKTKPDINNSEEKKKVLNLIKSDNSDLKRLQSLKDKLNPKHNCYSNNNTNNANTNTNTNNIGLQLLSIKRKVNNVDVNNNNKLIVIENNNNDKIVCKNVEQKNNQDLKLLTKLGDIQRPYHLQPVNFGMRENISHKNINNINSKFSPKTARSPNQNVAYFLQNSNQKTQNGPNFNSLDNNNIRNNNPQNYNFKPNYNNNIIAIHKVNRTYNNFPKINQDLSEKRNINNTNCVEVKDMNIISKTLSAAKIPTQATNNKVAAYIQKPKKILLTSPDNLPPNAFMRKKNRNIAKNNSFGLNGERNDNNNKRLKNLYNNNIYY